jgi:sugar-specific transcriptional regulator TrmB
MPIINEVLLQAGLDEKESEVYSILLQNGGMTVLEISKKSSQKELIFITFLKTLKT